MSLYPFPVTLLTPPISGGGGGTVVATGNQAASNPNGYSSSSLADPLDLGASYAPGGAVSSFTSGIAWNSPTPNQLHGYGPALLATASGSVVLEAFCEGGTNAQKFRLALYADNGNATQYQVGRSGATGSNDAGSRPGTLIGVQGEVNVAAGAGAPMAWRGDGSVFNVVAGTIYHLAIWLENIASGARFIRYNSGMNFNGYHTTGTPYASASSPPSTFPGSGSTTKNVRETIAIRARYTDPAPGPIATVTATPASGERRINVAYSAASNADRYRLERSANAGGSWDRIAILRGLTYPDRDVTAGTSYLYRVYPLRGANFASPTISNSATPTGVRVAYGSASPVALADTVYVPNPLRGMSGAPGTITGVVDNEEYDRTGFEWDEFQSTSNPATFNWSPTDTFLNNLDAGKRGWWRMRCVRDGATDYLPPFFTGSHRNGNWPNWNNSQVKTWLQAWIVAAGARYNNDPRLAVIDMGFYAQYGEWSGNAGTDEATAATKELMLGWITTAFSNKKIVMSAMDTEDEDDEETFWSTLNLPNVVGCRQDSLGDDSPYMARQIWGMDRSLRMQNFMRDPGFYRVCEYFAAYTSANGGNWTIIETDTTELRLGVIGGANAANVNGLDATQRPKAITSARLAGYRFKVPYVTFPTPINRANDNIITIAIENIGLGPLVEDRDLYIQFRQGGGVVRQQLIDLDLRTIIPLMRPLTIIVELDAANIPPAGTYDLCIEGPSYAGGDVPALNFDIDVTKQGGSYPLATGIVVQA